MSEMEVTISLFGLLALTQLFTIGLLFRIQSQINARMDSIVTEIRAEIRAFATEVRGDLRSHDKRLGEIEHRLARLEERPDIKV